MSIRARLLSGMVALVALGLAVAAVATYEEQRSFLMTRADQQVQSALVPVAFQLRQDGRPQTGARDPRRGRFARLLAGVLAHRPAALGPAADLPPGTFGELLGPQHAVIRRTRPFGYGTSALPPPVLPRSLPVSRPGAPLRLATLPARGGSGLRYRAAAFTVGDQTVLVAVPLGEVDATLHRLVTVEALVGAGLIAALIGLGWLVIRIGLRPLERIGRVASEIAGGDLSRRVSPADQRTEVGRLGQSLNEMLGQIERAFADRRDSEERLRRFLADASHELRTPLASIRGYAELFRLGAADDPATLERAMSRIEAEAARMGILVEDLLALAALDQAPDRPRVEVDVRELAAQAVQDTQVIAADRDVELHAPTAAVVLGDPHQLGQLVGNLMRNAVIHTPAGSRIEVGIATDGTPPRSIRLTVRDHGRGIPADGVEQLFERFWRSEGGRARGRGGAGLGLAIVRGIALAHGGTVSAGNAPGGGAVFTVTLPAAMPDGSQETLSVLTTGSYVNHPQ